MSDDWMGEPCGHDRDVRTYDASFAGERVRIDHCQDCDAWRVHGSALIDAGWIEDAPLEVGEVFGS